MASLADKKKALDWSNRNAQGFQGILDVNQFLPVTGDVQSGVMAAQDLQKGNYGSAALNAVGLLPFVPALGGMTKSVGVDDLSKLREQFKLALQSNKLSRTPETQNILNQARTALSNAENNIYPDIANQVENIKPTGILEYGMQHRPPMKGSGAPLYDLTGGGSIYPSDIYSNKAIQYYGTGDNLLDAKSFSIVSKFKGNPEAEIEIYRAVPKDVKGKLNSGDWVTINKDYARQHGENTLDGNYKIIKQKVKAKDIYTNGDSIHEFGYDPQP
jgi:hypothetical protein